MFAPASERPTDLRPPGGLEFELAIDQLHCAGSDPRVQQGALVEALLGCLAAAGAETQLRNVEFFHPLLAEADRVVVVILQAAEPFRMELRSRNAESAVEHWTLHAVAHASIDMSAPRALEAIAASPVAPGTRLHQDLTALGILSEDPEHVVWRVDIGMESGPGGLFALLRGRPVPEGFSLPPEALAVALELTAYLAGHREYEGRIARISSVWVNGEVTGLPALARAAPDGDDAWSLSVVDRSGATVAHLDGLRFEGSAERHERLLAAYLARVIEVAGQVLPFGVALDADTNLLTLGVTSLDAVRLTASLHAMLGSAPAIDRILARPTLRTIAAYYASIGDGPREPPGAMFSAPGIGGGFVTDAVSSAEQRLWYLQRHGEVGAAYNEAAAWQVSGPFDLAAFDRCLGALTARHGVLRTAYVEAGGRLSRRLMIDVRPLVQNLDLRGSHLSPADIDALLLEHVSQPFDLAQAPLLRAISIRLDDERHILLLVAHHVICDGWSLRSVIGRELGVFYRSTVRGEDARIATQVPLQMAEYATWEQALPVGHGTALVDWWAQELEGTPAFLDLPLDRPRPSQQRHRGAHVRVDIPEVLAADVHALARRMEVTPFVVLLAAYQVLMHRYSGQERFILGVPCSLRQGSAQESIVGCLVNTVPIAAALAPEQRLAEVVTAAHSRVSRALAHRAAPIERLVARLGGGRDASHTALTQVAFSFDEWTLGQLDLEGCRTERIELRPPTSKFDLMLQLSDEGGPLFARFEYNTDIFDEARIEAMGRHYLAILSQLRSDPSAAVGGEWLLAGSEVAALEALGRGRGVEIAEYDVRAVLDAGLEQFADSPAIAVSGVLISYAALGVEVARCAAALSARLHSDERLVAICASRSSDWVVAVLAAIRVGRAYLPIDPQTPQLRALALLEQLGVRTLLYGGSACPWGREFQGTGIALPCVTDVAEPMPRASVERSAPLWAITTSGSTGVPKTASVSYGGVANLLDWYVGLLDVTPRDRVLVVTSVAFDLTQKNLFVALMKGARLVLHGATVFDPHEVRALIEQQAVTIVNCTPSMLYALVEHGGEAAWAQLRSLRAVVLGGEPIDMRRLRPWLSSDACTARLINSYGPTECTDVSTAFDIDRESPYDDVPIGDPIQNVQLHVLDQRKVAVPMGVPGELHIGGMALGNGYLAAQEGSVDRFVALPDGRPVYASGDIVKYGWDGRLRFIGRSDTQTKIRGHRVSPGDVEAVVRAHPAISDAAVITSEDRTGNALHAYFVATAELSAADLRGWLIERLPRYMVPAALVSIAALPMTRSGKIDRKALPVPERSAQTAPSNEIESELLALWEEMLDATDLGVDCDFFQAGGHSILAIATIDEIEIRFGVRCRVLDLFERPTVRLMAELIGSVR